MKAAFVGIGKMGYPVSLAHCLAGGHEIFAYDTNPNLRDSIKQANVSFHEPMISERTREALESKRYHVCDSIEDALADAEVVLVAVPTPSLPDNSFDNSFVLRAVEEIGHTLGTAKRFVAVVIISTVLPGTTRTYIQPALESSSGKRVGRELGLDYSASFIAMGTTYEDAIEPEFVLVGSSDDRTARIVQDYFRPVVGLNTPLLRMTFEEAELVKNVYNVHIGFKIVIANAVMEMAHKLGHVNSDVVTQALGLANKRIVGPRYLKGGLGDAGPCHGRDALALSSVAKRLNISADPFEYIMDARDRQADWLAKMLMTFGLPVVILGERYKPNTNLTDYSYQRLVAGFVQYYGGKVTFYDDVLGKKPQIGDSSTFLVSWDEPAFKSFPFPKGSVVVDIWRCFTEEEKEALKRTNVRYLPIGQS